MQKKPSNLIYGLHDRPPGWITLLLGLQHICIIAISLVFPVLIVREMGGTPQQAQYMVSMSILAAGIGVIVQSLRLGPLGSGYLCPQVCGPSYVQASILAASTGGLSLLCGMTLLVGFFEGLFSRIIHRLQSFFPTEVTGLIVTMVGITVIRLAVVNFFGIGDSSTLEVTSLFVGVLTLLSMVGLNIWGRGHFKMFCILIGMVFGYTLSFMVGLLHEESLQVIATASIVELPLVRHPGFSFDWYLLVPMLIAMLCSALKSVGDLTTCQKINDVEWKRADLENVGQGILADSVGALSAGLLGGMGQSTSSSNIGLSVATGATSRIIAWVMGGLLVLLSLFPKVAAIFSIMPPPVIGATLIFALSFMIIAGIQIIMSRAIDARKTFVVGISMIIGLSVDIVPQVYQGLHPFVEPIFSSSLSAATICAVLLNLLFRIGIKTRVSLTILPGDDVSERIFTFMDEKGGLWGVRHEVLGRAKRALNELIEALQVLGVEEGIHIDVEFEELLLKLQVGYRGDNEGLEIPSLPPSFEEMVEDPIASVKLSLYLLKRYVDRISILESRESTKIQLFFHH